MNLSFRIVCCAAAALGLSVTGEAADTADIDNTQAAVVQDENVTPEQKRIRETATEDTLETATADSDNEDTEESPAFLIQSHDDTLVLIKKKNEKGKTTYASHAFDEQECEQLCVKGCYKPCTHKCRKKCEGSYDGDCYEDCFDDCEDDCEDECEDQCEQYEDWDEKSDRQVDISEIIDNSGESIAKSRRQGFGGGGGWTPAVVGLKLDPIVDLIRNDDVLGDISFPDLQQGYTPILMTGWMAYGGVGKGTRIGGGTWEGKLHYSSKPYDAPDSTDADRREIAVAAVKYSYGGLLLEKSFVHDQFNIVTGGMISFGSIQVKRDFYTANKPSAFTDLEDIDDEDAAKASLFGLELHGGFTYTVLPWVHLGADINAFFAASIDGFRAPGLNSFFIASPGLRLRLILGNIG